VRALLPRLPEECTELRLAVIGPMGGREMVGPLEPLRRFAATDDELEKQFHLMEAQLYERTRNEVAERPSDGEGPGLPDAFEDEVEGLYTEDFEWMLFSNILKDGVTAFEVYP
jgi:hypothetical protein